MLVQNYLDRDYADLLKPLTLEQVAPLGFLAIELTAIKWLGFSEWSLRLFAMLSSLAERVSVSRSGGARAGQSADGVGRRRFRRQLLSGAPRGGMQTVRFRPGGVAALGVAGRLLVAESGESSLAVGAGLGGAVLHFGGESGGVRRRRDQPGFGFARLAIARSAGVAGLCRVQRADGWHVFPLAAAGDLDAICHHAEVHAGILGRWISSLAARWRLSLGWRRFTPAR